MNQPPFFTPAPVPSRTSALAICSLVLGIVGLVILCIAPLLGLPAVICGHLALSRINRSAGQLTGRGLALAGLSIGYFSIALFAVLTPLAIPKIKKTRDIAVCVIHLAKIEAAKQQWAMASNKTNGTQVTEADLKGYLSPSDFKCPSGGVYTINPVGRMPTCSIPEHQMPQQSGLGKP